MCYFFVGYTLKSGDYQILIYLWSLVASDFNREMDSSKIKFYIKRLSMMICKSIFIEKELICLDLVVNHLFSFLFMCYDQYKSPRGTDTIGMLIPRWMGASMVVFNIMYKFENLRETPFAWLDIYFSTSSSSSTEKAASLTSKDAAAGISASDDSSSTSNDRNGSGNIDMNDSQPSIMDKIPHPNYSVGCIGYYGMALYTQSYTVLFFGLLHHATHILFL
jgi:hypothetical protein